MDLLKAQKMRAIALWIGLIIVLGTVFIIFTRIALICAFAVAVLAGAALARFSWTSKRHKREIARRNAVYP